MAKTNEQFDQHFKEKLNGHREKPSALAWERLESQLPKQSKPNFGIWWAIAASVTALLVAGYSFWPSENGLTEENLVAEKTELSVETPQEAGNQPLEPKEEIEQPIENQDPVKTEIQTEVKSPANSDKKSNPKPALNSTPQTLIAEATPQTQPEKIESAIIVEVPALKTNELEVAMPELKVPEVEKLVAEAPAKATEEPLYRVSIYSDGVKKGEPQEKNLITELGKTVGQVEGLIGKVDEGLITLQDKKDNLFASLTTKKSQGDEKP
ncbi:hypothetical protein [Algoriphagus litoralis]|uniref:hypothetical protein n=1 Tax=Algoriphagus litoralis TaxID=2202829 RepID=UPI000DBA7271|nr:hypothetical protein [Algoriphagus litoralis]